MESTKKLTDEEIVKALELCANSRGDNCDKCPYHLKEIACWNGGSDRYALDFIHRLQEENGQLKGYINGLEYEVEQRQKQVDELKEQFLSTCENCHLKKDIALLRYQKQQAVKDTAKEICDLILEHWEKKQFVECDWLRVTISERYGVEVE